MPDNNLIDAGDMRFRIEIQQNTPAKDTKGQKLANWETIVSRWASIVPASGQYFVASDQIRNKTSHKVVMRYYDGLTPRHRIKFGSRFFNILSVLNEGELKVRHTILAEEVI